MSERAHRRDTVVGVRTTCVALALALAFGLASATSAQLRKAEYENAPRVLAADAVPKVLLRSPHYRVEDDVSVSENTYHFRVDSDLGDYHTSSLALLRVRLHEIATLAQAVAAFNLSNRDLGAEIRGALSVRRDNFADILTSPLTTAASLAGQLTQNVTETVGLTKSRERANVPRDGSQSVLIDGVAAAHRRTVASQVGLDVYSSNTKVQEFFDAVVKARQAGRVGSGLTLVRTPHVATVRVAGGKLATQVDTVIRQLSAAEVNDVVREELLRMGVAPPRTQAFMRSRVLTPRHRLSIVAHLDFLGAMPNRGAIVALAAGARGEAEALAYVELTRMFASYHERVSRIRSIDTLGAFPIARTAKNLILFLPTDILHWDERADRLAAALSDRAYADTKNPPHLVVLGAATELAQTSLGRAGVDVSTQFMTPKQ